MLVKIKYFFILNVIITVILQNLIRTQIDSTQRGEATLEVFSKMRCMMVKPSGERSHFDSSVGFVFAYLSYIVDAQATLQLQTTRNTLGNPLVVET